MRKRYIVAEVLRDWGAGAPILVQPSDHATNRRLGNKGWLIAEFDGTSYETEAEALQDIRDFGQPGYAYTILTAYLQEKIIPIPDLGYRRR